MTLPDITSNWLIQMVIKDDVRTISAAYGGEGWQPRVRSLREEIGSIWHSCGVNNEWAALRAILVHEPGEELLTLPDPNSVQMLALVDVTIAQLKQRALVKEYQNAGVKVYYVNPSEHFFPNQMFAADLFFMTPEGAVLARPASVIRAGEERWVARRLSDLGVPILGSIHGRGKFEGADAAWLNRNTVLVGRGFRTNDEGAEQLSGLLRTIGVKVIYVQMPKGIMHLMGMLRFADGDLCITRPEASKSAVREALRSHGYKVVSAPDELENIKTMALNFVTLRPRDILMPAGNPVTQSFYENLGITCHTVNVNELIKAAGAVGCLTGILERDTI